MDLALTLQVVAILISTTVLVLKVHDRMPAGKATTYWYGWSTAPDKNHLPAKACQQP